MLEVQNLCRDFRVTPAIIAIVKRKLPADAAPAELTTLVRLPILESVFAQSVQQQDTRSIAQEIVAVIQLRHA